MLGLMVLTVSCQRDNMEPDAPDLPLAITHYYPNSGSGGGILTIEGENWGDDPNAIEVSFGSLRAELISIGRRQVLVRVPEGAGEVRVSLNFNGTVHSLGTFQYQSLSVWDVRPANGPVGSQIRIWGSGMAGGTGLPEVYINDVASKVVSVTDTVLTVEVPEGNGLAPIKVVVGDQESTGPNFQYVGVSHVTPLVGGAGSIIRIGGEGFAEGESNVSIFFMDELGFQQLPAQVIKSDNTFIQVRVPEGVGPGPVTVQIGAILLDGGFFNIIPPPGIFSVSPESGLAGTEVLIEGSYFNVEPGETTVYINEFEVPIVEMTETTIKLMITEVVTSGPLRVDVSGRSVEGPDFRYQRVGITALVPDNGLPGTEIQIQGSGFNTSPAANRVLFGGVEAQVLAATENSLMVRVPDGASSGIVQIHVDGMVARSPDEFLVAGVSTVGMGEIQLSQNGGSVTVDHLGNVYVLEIDHHRIVKITPEGQVVHFAGSRHGEKGLRDGRGDEILFHMDRNSALLFDDINNTIFLSDPRNEAFRRLSLEGASMTIPTPGQPVGNMGLLGKGNPMYPDDGAILGNALSGKSNAFFYNFQHVFADAVSVFMLSSSYGHIRFAVDDRRGPGGHLADVFAPSLNFTMHESVISKFINNGSIWYNYAGGSIAEWAGNQNRSGYQDGVGKQALFNRIKAITEENDQFILILDGGNHALRRVNKDNARVTTVFKNDPGFVDGDFRTARISSNVSDVEVSPDGTTAYILDNGNNAVRKVQLR